MIELQTNRPSLAFFGPDSVIHLFGESNTMTNYLFCSLVKNLQSNVVTPCIILYSETVPRGLQPDFDAQKTKRRWRFEIQNLRKPLLFINVCIMKKKRKGKVVEQVRKCRNGEQRKVSSKPIATTVNPCWKRPIATWVAGKNKDIPRNHVLT